MKKSFYISIIALFTIFTLYSQNSKTTGEKHQEDPLLKQDWSDIGTTPYAFGLKTNKQTKNPYLNLADTNDNTVAVGTLNYPIAASGLSEMPVYKPIGIYKMKVFKADSTTQMYLRIYRNH